MFVSPYETQYTREHREGVKNPSRNMTNRKALEEPMRRDAWLKRKAADRAV